MQRISFPSYNSTSADYLPGLVVAYMVAGLMIQPNSGHGEYRTSLPDVSSLSPLTSVIDNTIIS
jgi:hypothetical protein